MHKFKNDREYMRWCDSLSVAEYEKELKKIYRETEYAVNEFDDHGDIVNTDFYKTKKEAINACQQITAGGSGAEIEKVINSYKGGDLSLIDRVYSDC